MRAAIILAGIVMAVAGGVIAYRALFLDPAEVIVITDRGLHERPDLLRVVGGLALFIVGAGIAFFAARRRHP